jgi:hypothetical protein
VDGSTRRAGETLAIDHAHSIDRRSDSDIAERRRVVLLTLAQCRLTGGFYEPANLLFSAAGRVDVVHR